MPKRTSLTRREFFEISGAGVVGLTSMTSMAAQIPTSKDLLLYTGTYTTNGKSEGIYVHKFDLETGQLTLLHTVSNVTEPSFLVINKSRRFLYAVNETEEFEGRKSGAVSAFEIDRKTGNLRFLNKQPSLGGAPCHISISDNERYVLVANYVGGNVAVFPVERDGNLGQSVDLEQHTGSGPNRERQSSAHAHSIVLAAGNRFALATDLGADKVNIYSFDDKTGKLAPNETQGFYQTKPGAGPRHFAFHPGGKYAFVINELDRTITSLAFDRKRGTLKEIQTVNTLPPGTSTDGATCADVHVSPDGRFVYGSNRGHNSIVSYRIDEATGTLSYIEHVSTAGNKPRNFAIEPSGRFLLVANQDSDSIVVFRIDDKTGKLLPTGKSAQVPVPVCLKLIPAF